MMTYAYSLIRNNSSETIKSQSKKYKIKSKSKTTKNTIFIEIIKLF